ncbi:TIGR02646 family protein [Vibrio fluvialis]
MIKLSRPTIPNILKMNQTQWQKALDAAIGTYGSYKKIPPDEKEKLIKHYRHKDIQDPLFKSSENKCAFCECTPTEGGHIEVEHFKPKSLYPNATFEWKNFLPSCKKCNNSKLTHDTVSKPIVNPYDDDPKKIFFYQDIRIKSINDNLLGSETIRVCGLNKARLMNPRGKLLSALHEFSDAIEDALKDYHECETKTACINRLRKIAASLDTIEELTKKDQKYSAYSTYYLCNCPGYLEARKLVDEFIE